MGKRKAARIAGFVGAIGASAALVGFAATSTGAYFTDSHSGEVDASTGHVKAAISPADGKLSFASLLPGEYKTQTINYTAQGTAGEDIWLVFPMDDGAGHNPSEAFTGNPDDAAHGGLGRYGHLAITSPAGSFTSYNLSNPGTSSGHTGPSCPTDAYGHGGSNQQATDKNDSSVPFCAPKSAILLSNNLLNGQSGSATITFGFTPLLTGPQDAPLNKVADFKIVATQHGVLPNDPNNPTS